MSLLAVAGKQLKNLVRSYQAEPLARVAQPEDLVHEPKEWTVLTYLEGRDRLANSVGVALNGMEEIGSSDRVNLVAQATLVPEFGDRRFLTVGEMDTRRYYLTQDRDLERVTSPVVDDVGEQKRLTGQTLEEFLEWGIEHFPAKHYAVIIKKHGLGFAKDGESVPLSARETREALERVERKTGVAPDVLIWDACNMGQLEVAYELKDQTRVMTGSPEAIQAVQFPYPTLLHNLTKDAAAHDAQTVGQTVVQAYAAEAPWTTQSALDMTGLNLLGRRMKELVDSVLEAGVPREQLYTNLMKSGSYEPRQTLALGYNFRDVAGFLENVSQDPAIQSETVKEAARAARETLLDCHLDRHVDPTLAKLKGLGEGAGTSAFLPWREPSAELMAGYRDLAWCKDTGWDKLLDYILADAPAASDRAASHAPTEGGLGKLGLYAYKKFVSPYLGAVCSYDVTCSQYAREAVEDKGLVEGTKRAFIRVLSCQDGPGPDPCDHEHHHSVEAAAPELVLHPPAPGAKGSGLLYGAAMQTGRLLGGVVAAAVGAPVAAALGGFWGAKAGAGSLESYNDGVRAKYGAHQTHSLEKLQGHFTGAGTAVRERFGKVAGAVAGAVSGAALGLVGGGVFSYRYFGGFAGIGLQNVAKDALGDLPVHYRTEQILRRDYNG